MAKRGVLIKGGVYLEALGGLRVLAVDKTGTITEGKPRVQDVIACDGASKEEIIRVAAAIDAGSTHPLAQAVVRYAEENGTAFEAANDYKAKTGRGQKRPSPVIPICRKPSICARARRLLRRIGIPAREN